MVAALEGNKMARSGAGCVRARHRSHRVVRRRHHRHDPADLPGAADRRHRGEVHRRRLRRADGDRLRHGRHAARALAAQGRGQPADRAHHRPGRDRDPERPGAAHPRRADPARRHRRGHRRGRPVRDRRGVPARAQGRRRWHGHAADRPRDDDARGLAPVLARVAAGHGVRLPDRRAAGRWRGDPDVPLLRHRAPSLQAPRGVRPRRDRGCRGPGGGQQRGRGRRTRPAADHRPAHVGHGRGHPHRLPVLRPAAGAAAVQRVRAAGLRPAGQPLHRQRDAARAQPAAGPGVGQAAADPGVRASTPGSWCSPPWARSRPAAASPT